MSVDDAQAYRERPSPRVSGFLRMRALDRHRRSNLEKLTEPMRRGLLICLEDGELVFGRHYWIGKSGRKIEFKTVIAMYERYYVKIAIEHKRRGKHIAILTEPGERIARDLKRELGEVFIGEAASIIAGSI